jgi:hypothetical protein
VVAFKIEKKFTKKLEKLFTGVGTAGPVLPHHVGVFVDVEDQPDEPRGAHDGEQDVQNLGTIL